MSSDDGFDAEAHIEGMLKAVSGQGGVRNTAELMKDQTADLVKEAEVHKTEGNRFFADGKFEDALASYQKAAEPFMGYDAAGLDASAKKFLAAVCSNSAQAYLNLEGSARSIAGALAMAEKALSFEPTNTKARFRRGCAHVRGCDLNLARADFEWVLRMDPRNAAAKRELQSVVKQLRNEKESWERAAATAVANGRSDDPRSVLAERGAAAQLVSQQVEKAVRLKAAALKHWQRREGLSAAEAKIEDLRRKADAVARIALERVLAVEGGGGSLGGALGPQGAALAPMDAEQRRAFLDADAFMTSFKQAWPEDFAELHAAASTSGLARAVADNSLEAPDSTATELAARALDAAACRTLVESGIVVIDAVSILSTACLAKLRGEIEAADAYGVTKREQTAMDDCRVGVVKHAALRAKYQGSALLEVSDCLRGLAREVIRKAPLPQDNPKLWLGVPDRLRLVALDRGMRIHRHCDADTDRSRVWGALLFANPAWAPGSGGEMRVLHEPGAATPAREVEPRAGRLVVFDARSTSYEIAPVTRSDKVFAVQFWIHSVPSQKYWVEGVSD